MIMVLRSLGYYCREAGRSLVRNSWLSLSSIIVVAISLLILGTSLLLAVNADRLIRSVESSVEITVFLKNEALSRQVEELGKKIESVPGVVQVEFISKEEGLKELKESLGENAGALEGLEENNPLPDAYRIKTARADQVPGVALRLEKFPEVDTVRYGRGAVEKLLSVTGWLRTAGVIAMSLLALLSVFLIATTIRLSVIARRKEISIMKILGATNWFIRAPFVLEGMTLGFLGAAVSTAVLSFGYISLLDRVQLPVPFFSPVVDLDLIFQIAGGLVTFGLLIGALGSAISIRKHLRV